MTKKFKIAFFAVILLISMLPVSAPAAEQPKQAPPAPIPAQILEAKKVFVANAGGDELSTDDPLFSGDPDRAYNQFYAAMKTWGKYELVSAPADADLWFEIASRCRRRRATFLKETPWVRRRLIPNFGW